MTQRITVVPARGRAVPDPDTGDLLPAAGRQVTDSPWWRRRENDGDVSITTADLAAPVAPQLKPRKQENQ